MLLLVAAGLRCTLANSAYNARELAFQYTNSGARLIFTSEDGYLTVQETLKSLGLSQQEANQRVIVMTDGLEWAGGPAAASIKPNLAHLIKLVDLLKLGTLKGEERFDGEKSAETVYLCYSSGRQPNHYLQELMLICLAGTTGKPKGVEVRLFLFVLTGAHQLIIRRPLIETYHQPWTLFHPFFPGRTMTFIWDFYPFIISLVRKPKKAPLHTCLSDPRTGAVNLLHFALRNGCSVAIMQRFDPVQFCANIERYKIQRVFIVPPVLVVLARHPGTWNAGISIYCFHYHDDSCRPVRSVLSTNNIVGCSSFKRISGATGGFTMPHCSNSRFVDKDDLRCLSGLRVSARVKSL
jgi:4-coumarate--CoA ligase